MCQLPLPDLRRSNRYCLFDADPPEVKIERSRGGVVKEGGHVVLHCSYTANPRSITLMRWFKDDALLNVEENERLDKSNPGLPTLTIQNLTRRDRGRYGCGLLNEIGWGNSTNVAHLDVLCKFSLYACCLYAGFGVQV